MHHNSSMREDRTIDIASKHNFAPAGGYLYTNEHGYI
jgi:hypothetical protein